MILQAPVFGSSKKFLLIIFLFILRPLFSQPVVDLSKEMQKALHQYDLMLSAHHDTSKIPHSLYKDGSLRDMPSDWWTSGFFGANLWLLYEYSKDEKWKKAADFWSMAVQKEQFNTTTHDLGFMIYYPFGNGYRLTKNSQYKTIMLQGARSLATRFDPKRGVIKSWDEFKGYEYPVIIDNMMNLDFLFWASRVTGDKKMRDMAISHADATMKNHFRKDYSSYHVVCYGKSGEVEAQKTYQGYSDASAWSRGQAWGLYGYTMMYRETRNRKYLVQAMGIADFYLQHPNLPADKIPYWDFNAPNIPNEERDVSAAAIVCSALLELYKYSGSKKGRDYFNAAEKMLQSLSSDAYRNKVGENGNFLLLHSVGFKPGGIEVDVPLIYADYYYLEALMRYQRIKNK